MTKIYWCLMFATMMVVTSSFTCSKPADEMTMARQEENGNVTVDFTNFPSRTVWTLYPETGSSAPIRFDSDSLKHYQLNVPTNTKYRVHWKLVNVTTDTQYKA